MFYCEVSIMSHCTKCSHIVLNRITNFSILHLLVLKNAWSLGSTMPKIRESMNRPSLISHIVATSES